MWTNLEGGRGGGIFDLLFLSLVEIRLMDFQAYLDSLFDQIDGILSISLTDATGKELLYKPSPKESQEQSVALSKTYLNELFVKQCKDIRVLTHSSEASSKLEAIVTYSKTLQILQFSFSLEEHTLYFTVVAKQSTKTGILMELFRNTFIPNIQTLL